MFVWISNENWREILALSATLTTVLQFLTGVLIVRGYFKSKSTGEVSWLLSIRLISDNV